MKSGTRWRLIAASLVIAEVAIGTAIVLSQRASERHQRELMRDVMDHQSEMMQGFGLP